MAWEPHPPVALPDGTEADAVSVPLDAVLGWLVARGSVPSTPAGAGAAAADTDGAAADADPGQGPDGAAADAGWRMAGRI